jgi:CRISPR-associated endonuclease/helicase Cas3
MRLNFTTMRNLLAKSADRGLLFLEEHTLHVVQAIERFAKAYSFDHELARKGAILHDLGKGHPVFQAMLIDKPKEKREEWLEKLAGSEAIRKELRWRDLDRVPTHRHEYSSLAFLPLFPKTEWPALIDMVVAHHKSIIGDKSGRGLLDLLEEEAGDPSIILETHLSYFEQWAPAAIQVATEFGLPHISISKDEALDALEFAIEYVENILQNWSPYRGLLMTADHFASGFQNDTTKRTLELFQVPDTAPYEQRTKSGHAYLYPLSQVEVSVDKNHTLVTAPTGAGKTDFLVRRCKGRIFYTLPFQASINAMYKRFKSDFSDADIRRVHAASKVSLETEPEGRKVAREASEDVDMQHHPGASIKVMTPHQLSALVFGTPGHESIALDVRGQDVILDEVHTFSNKSQRMVLEIVRRLICLDCCVHIGTATLPTALAKRLLELLGGSESVYQVELEEGVLDDFDRHIIHKSYEGRTIDHAAMYAIIDLAIAKGERVLIVANQVKRAQAIYESLQEKYNDVPTVLIHSRFRRKDRATLEKKVVELQDASHGNRAAIAIATQVVEVSLDISYDRMITEAAPLDALIQRFGRVNRKRKPKSERELRPIHILAPSEKPREVLPYDIEVVNRSYDVLPDGEVFKEKRTQSLLDKVYPESVPIPTSNDYQFLADGTCRMKKLEHRPRGVIIEALGIEGQSCILASDVGNYRSASHYEKPLYEIPVPGNFNSYNKLPIEQSGSYPLILPDERYRFEEEDRRGLIPENQVSPDAQIL